MSRTTPCPTCPWRRGSDPTGAPIPGFSIDMMRGLATTVGEGDAFRPMMACHWAPEDACLARRDACIGYVHVVGYSNLAVRMAAMRGHLDLVAIWEACDGLDLYGAFHEMLAEYETAVDG